MRITRATRRLEAFPYSGRLVPEIARPNLRELLVGNYRIVYRVDGDDVSILGVRHGSRRLTDLPDP